MKKIKTGVKNLDRLLGGGIPEGEMILVKGEPGAGKSNLGLEYLYRGAKKGQNGLYISFQDTKDEILRVTTFDWNFKQYIEKDTINIRKFDPYRSNQIADMIRGAVKENSAERVVIDPITDLDLYIDSRKDIRKNLLSIKSELRPMGATTILVAEKNEATEIEEEISDGILEMELERNDGRIKRNILVKKLRGCNYNHGIHKYKFENDGLKIQ